MKNRKCDTKIIVSIMVFIGLALTFVMPVFVQAAPKPIVIKNMEDPISRRMQREITLDVRDMNIVDVIKFLALKGDFNVVVSPTVDGRVTVLLNNVSIKDAMDIVIISNRLAYKVEKNIVQVFTDAEYEAIYGKRFSDKTKVHIARLQYSKPSYVLAALDNIKSNVGKIIIDEDTGSVVMIDTPEAIELMKAALVEIEKPLKTITYALQYAEADVVAEKLRARIDAKAVGSITPDERTNSLIVRAYPDRAKEVVEVIKKLDTTTKEVMVDARILQIVLKPEYDVGIDWQVDFGGSEDALRFSSNYMNSSAAKAPTATIGDGERSTFRSNDSLGKTFGSLAIGDIDADDFEVQIRSLEQVSDTKILSNPKILVTNNEEAKIHIGDTVPYIISTTSGTGDNAITSEDVRFVDVGLKLNVTPNINDEGMVTMRLRPEISTVVAQVSSEGGGIPQVNKTEVETTVMVQDGNTIIMGGLKKADKAHVKKGFPVLMDLPWFGPAFGRTDDSITETEIVIFITPTILSGHNTYKDYQGDIKPFKEYSSK